MRVNIILTVTSFALRVCAAARPPEYIYPDKTHTF